METEFFKYSGSGNDFVILDTQKIKKAPSKQDIKDLCHRRFGVGADGVILVGASKEEDFSMRIFNSDGGEAEMCGNGARCSIHYYHYHVSNQLKTKYQFNTMNGTYSGEVLGEDLIQIKMTELYDLEKYDVNDLSGLKAMYLNTGVPHTVIQVTNVDDVSVNSVGRAIRFDKRFEGGSNVCFFHVEGDQTIKLRVYERGVEAETLCCGTGVMASAVASSKFFNWSGAIKVSTKGGDLLTKVDKDLSHLYFIGDVRLVFRGQYIDAKAN